MLVVFCLLLLLGLGHCQDNDLPSGYEIESSINRTIEEVERQVRENPKLPRLSRQEIVGILRNITSQDLNAYKDKEKLEKARRLYQRALMVVLPYNAEESPGNLNDLYTKPPMTQIIPDRLKSANDNYKFAKDKDNEVKKLEPSEPSTVENLISTENFYKPTTKGVQSTTTKNKYKNHRETYSEVQEKVPLKETLKLDSTPVRFTFNLENLQKNSYTTEKTTTTRYPVYRNNGEKQSDLEIVYSTSVTEEPTTKPIPKEIIIDLDRSKATQNVLTSSQWRYNAPPSTLKPTLPSHFEKIPFLPTVNVQAEDSAMESSSKKSEVYENDKNTAEALIMKTEGPTTLYVTPMSTETSSKAKYSSTYSLNSAGFRTGTTSSTSMRPEVMDLLESIGLRPDNSSNVEDVYKKNKDMLERNPELNNIVQTISGSTLIGSDTPSILDQNTFEGAGSEIKKGMENLTPEVRLLFQRFGLQTSNVDRSSSTTERIAVNLNSYTNFKPLPTSSVKDQGMKEFLAKFGLGVNDNRRQKSMKSATQAPSLIEAVPDNMRDILVNIGLISNSRKRVRSGQKPMEDMESTETSKFHVFKPHEANVRDEDQRSKINELLDTVKLVQQGKADIQNVRKVANDLIESTKTLKDGPDPLKLEEIIRNYSKELRNEVKRQQEQGTTVVTTTEETTVSSMTTTEPAETTLTASTSADSAKSATDQTAADLSTSASEDSSSSSIASSTSTASNLMALEESFGGTTREPDPVLPPKRKNGLYFLVDWNTFLEVGEDEKEKINLRFQPKVGDRTRFLPVSVP